MGSAFTCLWKGMQPENAILNYSALFGISCSGEQVCGVWY